MQVRQHQGSLESSMKTLKVIGDTLKDLLDHMYESLNSDGLPVPLINEETVTVKYYSEDKRINWEKVYIINIKDYGVYGFCDKMPILTHEQGFGFSRLLGNDDFSDYSAKLRSDFTLPYITDDHLANLVFMRIGTTDKIEDLLFDNNYISNIVIGTAAKERIRWLSRKLEQTEKRIKELESK